MGRRRRCEGHEAQEEEEDASSGTLASEVAADEASSQRRPTALGLGRDWHVKLPHLRAGRDRASRRQALCLLARRKEEEALGLLVCPEVKENKEEAIKEKKCNGEVVPKGKK